MPVPLRIEGLHHTIKYKKLATNKKRAVRRTVIRIQADICGASMSVHDNFHGEALLALNERVVLVRGDDGCLKEPPKPEPGIFAVLHYFLDQVVQYVKAKHPGLGPLSVSEFLALCPADKRKRFADAFAKLKHCTISRKLSFIAFFVKAEKTNFTRKPNAVPRAIQPRTPEYCALLGKYIKHLEHTYYEAIAHIFGAVTVTKGLNADEVGQLIKAQWDKYKKPVGLGWDANRFDEHVSLEAMRDFEHLCYTRVYSGKDRAELQKLLNWQLRNKGFAYTKDNYKITYETRGGRMSGDMNTALGNCLIMCAMTHYICKKAGISNFSLINNGDDCILIMESVDLWKTAGFPAEFLRFGFSMKMEPAVRVLEHIVFCQSQPINMGDGSYRMVRQLKTALCKDTTINSGHLSRKSYDEWRNAVSKGGLSLCSRVPVFQNFYLAMGRNTSTTKHNAHIGGLIGSGFYRLARGMTVNCGDISDITRASFYVAFGLTPYEQRRVEADFDQADFSYGLGPPESTDTSDLLLRKSVLSSNSRYQPNILDYVKW